jgi:hypothetical protein
MSVHIMPNSHLKNFIFMTLLLFTMIQLRAGLSYIAEKFSRVTNYIYQQATINEHGIKSMLAIALCLNESSKILYLHFTQQILLSGDVELNPGPNAITMCHINIRGLSAPKLLAIKHGIQHYYDIITFSETFLSSNSTHDLRLDGYQPIVRKDRDTFGGGVAAYLSNNLAYVRRHDLEMLDTECLWLQVNTSSTKFLIAVVYRPPNSDNMFWEHLETMYDNAISLSVMPIIFAGDLNADPTTRQGVYLDQFATSNLLTIHVTEPTRITETSATILDQFVSNCPNLITNTEVHPPLATNDHCTISINIRLKMHKPETFTRHIWLYNKANFNGLNLAIRRYDWDTCFQCETIDEVLLRWTMAFLSLAREFIPNKTVTIRPKDVPWFSNEHRQLKKDKDRLHKIAKRSNLPVAWHNFRAARNKYVGKLREAENKYKQELASTLQNPANMNSKKWWQLTKKFMGKFSDSTMPPITDIENDVTIFDATAKAELFNRSFISYSKLDDSNAQIPNMVTKKTTSTLKEITITENEVLDILLSLNTSKASGPDMISTKMLKETAHSIAPSLHRLIVLSLRTHSVPQGWREANVTPIHKKGTKSLCNNYRPISLLNITAKVCEKVVFKHLFNYIKDNNLITTHQSGFIPGDSTVNQLVYLYNLFAKALNDKQDIVLVFCDQSKAFDKVWHPGLIYKLQTFGITDSLLLWFKSYLANRRQRVTIKNAKSSWKTIQAGVPQGSILGPLLFLIHINDIIDGIESQIKLFADDTSLFLIVDDDQNTCRLQLNRDLERIDKWAKSWLVTFNPEKTKLLHISLKHNVNHPILIFNNHQLEKVEAHKHLGITFNDKLTWTHHINNIFTSANVKLILLSKLKFILDRKTLFTLYTSFIRPCLEYGNIIWNNLSETDSDKLESVQRRAMRIITGCITRTSTQLLYEETNLEKLAKRRERSILLFFHKIINNNTPDYLQEMKPDINVNRHGRNLRSSNNFTLPYCRINRYQDSFLPTAINLWNQLDEDVRNIFCYNSFKCKLEKDIQPNNPLFNLGNRNINIVMSKLRTNSSDLNGHLFNLNLTNDSRCKCGYFFEDCFHFFFICPLYLELRTNLLNFIFPLAPVTLHTLLHGCNDIAPNVNNEIYLQTINYVEKTKRFT